MAFITLKKRAKPAPPEKPPKEKRGKEKPVKVKRVKEKTVKEKPVKKRPLPKNVRGARFIFLIGDEGTILVYSKNNVVQSRHFVPDAGSPSLDELKKYLAEDPKAPIAMIVDNMDQSYVQQTLPPVSSMSVQKLIKRRLDRDFGVNDIKGAIMLGREESGRKDWNFLMVSLEKTPQLTAWLDFALELPNRFLGIFLLSVETENVIRNLQIAMGVPKEGSGAQWMFFVSHNKVGGFRQVILRNGHFIFTRMTQPIGEMTPEVIAGNIEQEMLSTIEYMKRFGYDEQAGLDVCIVLSASIKSVVDTSRFNARTVTLLTPYEAAQHLRIEGATQPTDQFGDVILAASIGGSRKHILTLSTPQSRQYDTMYQLLRYGHVAAVLAVLGMFGYAGSLGYDAYTAYQNKGEQEERKAAHKKTLSALNAEIKASGIDVDKTNDTLDLYQQLTQEEFTPLPFFARLRPLMGPSVRVKSIKWSVDAGKTPTAAMPSKMIAVFTLSFIGAEDQAAFKAASKQLLDAVKAAFKGYDIAYTKTPTGFVDSQKLDITLGGAQPATLSAPAAKEIFNTELTVKGPLVKAPDAAAHR